jgi:hypothetical protein
MPVVIGQPKLALYRRAMIPRIWLMVINLPSGTLFMVASTSSGEGITTVPSPHFLLIFSLTSTTRGKPCFSVVDTSFWRQVSLTLAIEPHPLEAVFNFGDANQLETNPGIALFSHRHGQTPLTTP